MDIQQPVTRPLAWTRAMAPSKDLAVRARYEALDVIEETQLMLAARADSTAAHTAEAGYLAVRLPHLVELHKNAVEYAAGIDSLAEQAPPPRWGAEHLTFRWTCLFGTTKPYPAVAAGGSRERGVEYDCEFSDLTTHRLMARAAVVVAVYQLGLHYARMGDYSSARACLASNAWPAIASASALLTAELGGSIAIQLASRAGVHYVLLPEFWAWFTEFIDRELLQIAADQTGLLTELELGLDTGTYQLRLAREAHAVTEKILSHVAILPLIIRAVPPDAEADFVRSVRAEAGNYLDQRMYSLLARIRACYERERVALRQPLARLHALYKTATHFLVGRTAETAAVLELLESTKALLACPVAGREVLVMTSDLRALRKAVESASLADELPAHALLVDHQFAEALPRSGAAVPVSDRRRIDGASVERVSPDARRTAGGAATSVEPALAV